MSHLSKAMAASERSYLSAKQSVASATRAMFTQPGEGNTHYRPDLAKASEQLRYFTGWVYAAVRPIAQAIAGQLIHVGRRKRPGRLKSHLDVEQFDSHPLLDLLHDPNDLMVSWSLMFATVASLELTGRALWWLPQKKHIYPIPISWIVGYQGTTEFSSWLIRPPGHTGDPIPIPATEACYFAYPSPADPHGVTSPLAAAATAVHTDTEISRSQIAAFEQGIHPTHAISVGKHPHTDMPGGVRPTLTAAQQRQIIEAIKKRYAGTHQHGEPVILDGLIDDIKRLSNTPKEMDWTKSAEATKARILQIFGTNPIVLGEIQGANRASATVADRHFAQYTVNPKIQLISESMTEWLAPQFGSDLEIWIEPVVASDDEMELKWAELLSRNGALTRSDLRALSPFDLPQIQDEEEPRSALLETAGGMTGSVQILQALGQGFITPDSAARLLALFLQLDESEARAIAGDGSTMITDERSLKEAMTIKRPDVLSSVMANVICEMAKESMQPWD